MTQETLQISGLPDAATIQAFAGLISSTSTDETAAQKFIVEHPDILAPLELVEVVQHLRFPKRHLLRPVASAAPQRVRIPDFVVLIDVFQVVDIAGAGDKPEQLRGHDFPGELFSSDSWKAIPKIVSSIKAEAGNGSNTSTVGTLYAVIKYES